HQIVRSINKKYCLLLTAAPIQNDIIELFNLVSIIKPGLLGDLETFKKTYVRKKSDQRPLHQLIQRVMVRNRRKETILDDVKRNIETVWLSFSKEEQQVYDELAESLQRATAFSSLVYLKELCSCGKACYVSLQNQE